ncbi:MAG: hypothetical protein FD137_1675 [Spirochaetes bacterium]|nr:MAG: hypothetical protein FD137_1675 [Spirochaetota bacterium]
MVFSLLESSRFILNKAKGVRYPVEEYSWISLEMIIEGSKAPLSMTHITVSSRWVSILGILCTAKFCTGTPTGVLTMR